MASSRAEPRGTPVVSLRSLWWRLRRKTILRDVNLDLFPGEVVGLIGPGGSGKTQLIRHLATLQIPRKGETWIFDARVSPLNRRALRATRRKIGLQFQNFALFDYMDVRRNVGFSLEHGLGLPPEETDRRVTQALELVGLGGDGAKFPAELSGGMRRRVAIARVVAARPEVALFDDPVSGLDPVNSAKIMALLQRHSRATGCLSVIASHDLERLLLISTRVVALFDGAVCYDGEPRRLLQAADERVRRYGEAALRKEGDSW